MGAELREKLLKAIGLKPGEDSGLHLDEWASYKQQGGRAEEEAIGLKPGEDIGLCLGEQASDTQHDKNRFNAEDEKAA